MTQTTIGIVYCKDNQAQADEIRSALGTAAEFHLFGAGTGADEPHLSELTADFEHPLLLLVSDNFLRNVNCMYEALPLLDEEREVLPIVLPGFRTNPETGTVETVPTSFERVSDIISYINLWQDRYLNLRKQKDDLSESGGEHFEHYLRKVKEISSEIGEFLRLLRQRWTLQYGQFTADAFHQFFIFAEREEDWEAFKLQYSAPETAAPTIPSPELEVTTEAPSALSGEDLLDTTEAQTEPEEEPEEEEQEEQEEATVAAATAEMEAETPPVDVSQIPGMEMLNQREKSVPAEAAAAPTPAAPETDLPPSPPAPELTDKMVEKQAADWIAKAWKMADQGDYAAGARLLGTGIEAYPNRADLRYHLALLHTDWPEGDLDTAERELENVLRLEPGHTDARYLRADLADLADNRDLAIREFKQLAEQAPEYPELNYRLGLLLAQDPDYRDEALERLSYASENSDNKVDAAYQYASLLAQRPDPELRVATAFERVLDMDPQHPFAAYDLALLHHRNERAEAAKQYYLRAIAINPELHTAENDQAFGLTPPTATSPTMNEKDALSALKENIAHLEGLLREREDQAAERARTERPGHGKTVLISGATSGIGRATAVRFAAAGYRLILTGRRSERLEDLSKDLSEAHEIDCCTLNFDVRDQEATQHAIEELDEAWQDIDILINNAGKAKGFDPIHTGDIAHWDEMIDTNLKGLLYLTRAVSPGMVRRGRGMIVNVCSTAGKEVYPNGNVYCATKHAVDALTYAMRLDLHTHGIRVGQVCPAHVEETEFAKVRFDGDEDRAAKVYEDFQPLRSPDVAEAIYFIVSQPEHVNVLDIVLQGKQQAHSMVIDRSGREE
jgi:NADP-dependent 3-hydroxy acid dehydrogenase YdfG/Tfp pilus assembly protein PilF